MPTRADFEAAASNFSDAAEQVGGLTVAVEQADAGAIIRGGLLGQQVPARIAAASATARTCQTLIEAAADTCRERAAIIADYEVRLASFDLAAEQHAQLEQAWGHRYARWRRNPTRFVPPGARPVPPVKPTPPPPWADVRRP